MMQSRPNIIQKEHSFVITFVEIFSKIKNKLERETELIFFASVETGASVETEPTTKKTKTQPGSVEQVVAVPLSEFAEFGPCQKKSVACVLPFSHYVFICLQCSSWALSSAMHILQQPFFGEPLVKFK